MASDDPDWQTNPFGLRSPDEVRDSLRAAGLNPMNVGTPDEAAFGHSLVHSFADDPDHGGRTESQLEAEHDLTVDAMLGFGMEHDSPLDREDIL